MESFTSCGAAPSAFEIIQIAESSRHLARHSRVRFSEHTHPSSSSGFIQHSYRTADSAKANRFRLNLPKRYDASTDQSVIVRTVNIQNGCHSVFFRHRPPPKGCEFSRTLQSSSRSMDNYSLCFGGQFFKMPMFRNPKWDVVTTRYPGLGLKSVSIREYVYRRCDRTKHGQRHAYCGSWWNRIARRMVCGSESWPGWASLTKSDDDDACVSESRSSPERFILCRSRERSKKEDGITQRFGKQNRRDADSHEGTLRKTGT